MTAGRRPVRSVDQPSRPAARLSEYAVGRDNNFNLIRLAAALARRFAAVERVARIAVGAADATAEVLGHRTVAAVTNMARAVVSKDLMPGWLPNQAIAIPGSRSVSIVY